MVRTRSSVVRPASLSVRLPWLLLGDDVAMCSDELSISFLTGMKACLPFSESIPLPELGNWNEGGKSRCANKCVCESVRFVGAGLV